jgi:hypothetical protein
VVVGTAADGAAAARSPHTPVRGPSCTPTPPVSPCDR